MHHWPILSPNRNPCPNFPRRRTCAAWWPSEVSMASSTMACARGRCRVRATATSRLPHCGQSKGRDTRGEASAWVQQQEGSC